MSDLERASTALESPFLRLGVGSGWAYIYYGRMHGWNAWMHTPRTTENVHSNVVQCYDVDYITSKASHDEDRVSSRSLFCARGQQSM